MPTVCQYFERSVCNLAIFLVLMIGTTPIVANPIVLARRAIASGDFNNALEELQKASSEGLSQTDLQEMRYLTAYVLANLPSVNQQEVAEAIQKVISEDREGLHAEKAHFLLGIWQYRKGEIAASRDTLSEFAKNFPNSMHMAEALFYTAQCHDQLGDGAAKARSLFTEVYQTAPEAPFAGEAYFYSYPYEDYLAGNDAALTHLQQMSARFPNSPYLILAYYLNGMKTKRSELDKTSEQVQRWTQTIEIFQRAQALYESLSKQNSIPSEHSDYFTALYFRAGIERAQANLAIALASSSAKRQIWLEYTKNCYRELLRHLEDRQDLYFQKFHRSEAYHPLVEECQFGLAQAYLKSGDDATAESLLLNLVLSFQARAISRGYYLAKAHSELANIAIRAADYAAASGRLHEAEDCSRGRVLSTDERLNLFLSQSLCQQQLGNIEAAMVQLSKVINDDCISGLRLKAMLLRANLYEIQGRHELAHKQLVALARKGGEWANQAKIKLESDYGHHE